jgi:hypothetical protein
MTLSSERISRFIVVLTFGLISLLPVNAIALCQDGRHPGLQQEFAASKFVITGRAWKAKVVSSPDDPNGILATTYSVRVLTAFKGHPERELLIWSENTSSRFEIDLNQDYLMFIREDRRDGFYIDNCGNSGLKRDQRSKYSFLRSMNPKP